MRGCLALVLLATMGCQKPNNAPPTPWHTRALTPTRAQLDGVQLAIELPAGLGVYKDARAYIWRPNGGRAGPWVKVARVDRPADLAEAATRVVLEHGERIIRQAHDGDDLLVVIAEANTPITPLRIYRWRNIAGRSFLCWTRFHAAGHPPASTKARNEMMQRVCSTLRSG